MRRETDSWQLAPKWQLWLIVAGIKPMCGERQTQGHRELSMISRPPPRGASSPRPRESCPSCLSLYSFLSPWYPRFQNPRLGWKQEKKPQVLWAGVRRCRRRPGSGPTRKEPVCPGSTARAAYLRAVVDVRAMCPLSIWLPALWGEGDMDGNQRIF